MINDISIKPDDKIHIRRFFPLQIGNDQWAYIQPETGSWFMTAARENELITRILFRKEFDLLEQNGLLLNQLYKLGFLEINEKSGIPPDFFSGKNFSLFYFILNVTSDCNFRCTYCYNASGTVKNNMPPATGERCLEVIAGLKGMRKVILLHGGEPLLNMPLIERLVSLREEKTEYRNIQFSIQTNASLIDNEIAEFLRDHHISVSVSIDGASAESNIHRRYTEGSPALGDILRGMDVLKRNQVEFGCIAMLTQANHLRLDSLLELLKEYNIGFFALNPLVKTGRAKNAFDAIALSNDDLFHAYKQVLKKLAHFNRGSDPGCYMKERNTNYMIANLLSRKRSFMCQRGPCGAGTSLMSIASDGSIYPCDDFVNIPEFCMGNIRDADIEGKIVSAYQAHPFSETTPDKISECSECPWCWICNAGCTARRYHMNGDIFSADPLCPFYKRFFPYLLELWTKGELKNIYVDH